ncbi:MFS transporter [Patulibacter defluvii]|uniref:MFS transporter n=1 Tax=Patulibacter defluvii TaxID=3095358 RepID=UPI002A757590|nr:MFS transporter [Patulibacter sp. DM4]
MRRPTDPVALSRGRRWAALAVLSASLLVVTMDLTILNVALPELAADIEPSATEQLWIVDVYSLVLAGLLISMSAFADRRGRKLVLLAGFAVFGGASALVVVADSPLAVIAVRALLGIGGAMIMPTTLSMVRSIFLDPAERATALGVWSAVSAVGAAVGPIVGGFLLEHFSWQAAFLVNVPLMVLGIAAGVVLLPEVRVPRPGRWDAVATALSIAGMVALIWSIKHFAKQQDLLDPLALAALAAALVLLVAFVRRCLRRDDPLLDVRLFASRPFTAGVVAALGTMFGLAAVLFLLAQWLQLVEHHGPLAAGVRLLPLAGAGLLSSIVAPPLAARIGPRLVLAAGLAVAGAGLLVLGLAGRDLAYGTVAVALALVGGGVGSLAMASAIIMLGTPNERAGSAAAIEESAYDVGNVLGVAILGSVAALLYRDGLDLGPALSGALGPEASAHAEGSLAAATAIADEARLPALASHAGDAFVSALADTSLIGGVAMLAVAALVFVLVPRGMTLTGSAHH